MSLKGSSHRHPSTHEYIPVLPFKYSSSVCVGICQATIKVIIKASRRQSSCLHLLLLAKRTHASSAPQLALSPFHFGQLCIKFITKGYNLNVNMPTTVEAPPRPLFGRRINFKIKAKFNLCLCANVGERTCRVGMCVMCYAYGMPAQFIL